MSKPALDSAGDAERVADDALLAHGLAAATRSPGWTSIAIPTRAIAAPALIAAWRAGPLVSWSRRDSTYVGLGVAREVRGRGDARWNDVIAGAHELELGPRIGDAGLRWLGGLAFAPGAADAAPWDGFGDAWFVLPRWTYVREGRDAWLVLAIDARDARNSARWHDELQALRGAIASGFQSRPQPPMVTLDRGDGQGWRLEIDAITRAIAAGECEKIVAARQATVTLAGDVRPADLLAELDARHPDCTRLLIRAPSSGAFVAATPERLVEKRGLHVACDALAGSLARTGRDDHRGHDALLASTKDRREHQLVVDAVVGALRQLNARVSAPAVPQIRQLRHVLHLHTPVAATLHAPHHVLEIAARLHPTPAVGGTPAAIAKAWIASREAPRGWYASPIGWFDANGDGELAVGIRSGLLVNDHAHVWAGAGIVAGSEPELELAETELKLRAMLGALGVSA
jgi:menaquinone-specific isochorismate synthase